MIFQLNDLQSRKVETPYVTGDMLKGPFKYFGGVVEPWWVTSLGVGFHVPEGVPLFYRVVGYMKVHELIQCGSAET